MQSILSILQLVLCAVCRHKCPDPREAASLMVQRLGFGLMPSSGNRSTLGSV